MVEDEPQRRTGAGEGVDDSRHDGAVSARIRVLHVDDDPGAAETAAECLEREDDRFVVETATGAGEGLERLADGAFDCVVSDYELPGRDGIEFLERVREKHPGLPFVLFTAGGSEAVASEAISAGVTDYLRKGDGTDQYAVLANTIANAVERGVTERTERELREKSSQLDTIFEDLPISLYFKDDEARHVRVSEAHATGYTGGTSPRTKDGVAVDGPEDYVGKTDLELFPEENAREPYEDDRHVIETGEPILNKEERIDVVDGRDRWVTTTKVPWCDDGEIKGLVGFTLDITDHKERERELERRNERLEEFASVVSHDLRNPLNVARGRLDLAREECDSDHLDAVDRAHGRMEALIGDLLSLARHGESVDELAAVEVGAAVEGCWRTVETTSADLVVDTDRAVRADPDRLKQLLENLIRNAVEHGDEDVTVTIGDLDDGFYVADDGPGIPEADRDRVFEAGHTTAEEGTGFGLSIVNRIAEAHGWDIAVTESEHGGARFEITGVEFA